MDMEIFGSESHRLC